jgi:uncharacterized membrane-anchored protein YitT (DUF2179 family)
MLPFWVSSLLAIAGMFYFNLFIEAVIIFLMSDFIYGVSEQKFHDNMFVSFLVSMILLTIIEIVKRKLKFYPEKR